MFKIIFSAPGTGAGITSAPAGDCTEPARQAPRLGGFAMPYSSDHRVETKNRIIKSARRLFNGHGFDCVTIALQLCGWDADPASAGNQAEHRHGH
ncbi:MAG: hypothetical protein ACXWLJ_09435 [Rhizomicrobium sp.]